MRYLGPVRVRRPRAIQGAASEKVGVRKSVREVKTNQTKAPSAGAPPMTQRKSEVTARMNERDYPHIVELLLPPEASDPSSTRGLLSTESAVSSTVVVEAASPMGSFTSDFALPIQRTPMLFVIGLAESG